ncbi:hypothetical protein [Sphingopyxis sp.]|uniref:hypothetical protein n=1 Tax=Sphingopyxis sp. TaxID=1908224 RepID=UPI001D869F1E|nr:hypothetical protein [Sphingopyxis sp.]MBW8295701.1 hypothetical protein [Sphingopyxis sp.]
MTVIQRDKLVEIGVFAILGGISGASIGLLWVEGFKAEHIFALAGALIGAAATVGGAIWVTDRNERQAHKRETEILIRAIQDVTKHTDRLFSAVLTWDGDAEATITSEFDIPYIRFKINTDKFRDLLEEALAHAKTLNFEQRHQLKLTVAAVEALLEHRQKSGEREGDALLTLRDWQMVTAMLMGSLVSSKEALETGRVVRLTVVDDVFEQFEADNQDSPKS